MNETKSWMKCESIEIVFYLIKKAKQLPIKIAPHKKRRVKLSTIRSIVFFGGKEQKAENEKWMACICSLARQSFWHVSRLNLELAFFCHSLFFTLAESRGVWRAFWLWMLFFFYSPRGGGAEKEWITNTHTHEKSTVESTVRVIDNRLAALNVSF